MADVIMIGGAVGQEQDDADFITHANPVDIIEGKRMEAEMRLYLPEEDEVRRVKLGGVIGTITLEEPSIEDRQFVNALRCAQLLAENMLDVHDFKQILQWAALSGTVDNFESGVDSDKTRVLHAMDKMISDLGGYDL